MAAPPPNNVTDVVLTLDDGTGPEDFSCSLTGTRFVASPQVNTVRTFCGVKSSVGASGYMLDIGGLQDYFQAISLSMFLANHEGEQVEASLTWTASEDPNVSMTATATVTCVASDIGGDADAVADYSASLPVQGTPVRTHNIISS